MHSFQTKSVYFFEKSSKDNPWLEIGEIFKFVLTNSSAKTQNEYNIGIQNLKSLEQGWRKVWK